MTINHSYQIINTIYNHFDFSTLDNYIYFKNKIYLN